MALLAPVAAIVLLGAIVASGMTPLSNRLADIFSNLSEITRDGDFSSSIGIRLALWNIAVDVWLQKPLIGYGAGKLPELISYHLISQYNISEDFGHFHNVFLNTLVEGGVLAFLGLVAMIVIPLHAAFRVLTGPSGEAERFGAAVLVLLFTMFLITGLTNLAIRHDIMDAVFMIFLVVGLYLAIGTSARSRADIAAPVGSPAA
jgi:O-antigen ligase